MVNTRALGLVLVTMVTVVTSQGDMEDDVDVWLEDLTRPKVSSGIQSDSPGPDEDEPAPQTQCPPTPPGAPRSLACLYPKCRADSDCGLWPVYRCCQNGCVQTCTVTVPAPPYIDWRREPQGNFLNAAEPSVPRYLAWDCTVDDKKYRDGETFGHHRHQCRCHQGIVDCDVRRPKKRPR